MFSRPSSVSPTSTIQVVEPWQTEINQDSSKRVPPTDRPFLEYWSSLDDEASPHKWPQWQRIRSSLLLAFVSLLSSFASSIIVPAIPDIILKFQLKSELTGTLLTSLYVLGLGLGPFILAPLSEIYGRRIIYIATLAIFTVMQIGCALIDSIGWLIVFRLISGICGGMAPSLGQASLADIWEPAQRGQWAALVTLGTLLGAPLGNCVAAILLQEVGLIWIFWTLTIYSATFLVLSVLFLKESYPPVILERRQRLHRNGAKKADVESSAELKSTPPIHQRSIAITIRVITRPLRFLLTSPVVLIVGFLLAYTYGIFYVILTSLPLLFGRSERSGELFNYSFATLELGLSYIGLMIGFLIGFIIQMNAQPRIWKYLTNRNGEGRPEYRLLPITVGMVFYIASLLLYGWSAEKQSSWVVPEIALMIFAIGEFIIFQSIQVYLAEAFIPFSASAIAAATLLRALTGATFPLFAKRLFSGLGYGLGGTVLSIAVFPAIPLPWFLYQKGTRLRKSWEFKP